ncbi:MAG TPA: hypothetical protein VG938_03855 [Verrucomicrobiae bacterium]|jgi:hypothetical protein|nr:hypothetical protein [Verrucomicrobiae bacterium]
MSTQTPSPSSTFDTVIGFAVLGCLVAGGVGIVKALGMNSGVDVLLCLVGSSAAFGTVLYFCFHKD